MKEMTTDKFVHAGVCFILCVFVTALFWFADAAIVIGALAAIAAGIGKEIYDVVKGGGFDILDFAWDLIGALCAAVCLCLIKYPLW